MVMGILNITPDSSSDCGRFLSPDAAAARGRRPFDEGPAVLDVGGESTRPGAAPVPIPQALDRLLLAFLAEAVERGRAAGVPEVWVDPGIGFGKTTDHNLELLSNLRHFTALGVPVVLGASRKRFIGELHARSDGCAGQEAPTHDRLEGSLAAAAWAFAQGVSVVRAHDAAATVDALKVVAA